MKKTAIMRFFSQIIILLIFPRHIIGMEPEHTSKTPVSIQSAKLDCVLIAGRNNHNLAKTIAQQLNISLHPTKISTFNDGEISVKFTQSLRGKDVYIIQSTVKGKSGSVNDALMELLLMIDALKRSSSKSITAVIPYFGYARQDRKLSSRVPISAALVSHLIEKAGADRVISVDLHAGQIQGFFKIPVDNLHASSSFAQYIKDLKLDNIVVVSPDAGGVERARTFQKILGNIGVESEFALIVKERAGAGKIAHTNLIGTVSGKNIIIVDDIVDTAGTLTAAASELKKAGAKRIYGAISHPVLSGPAHKRIANSVFEKVIVSDSIPLTQQNTKIEQLSLAPLLAEVIRRTENNDSVSSLFHDKSKA